MASEQEFKTYRTDDAPTLRKFHESPDQIRCVVGPVGSGKTSAATWEVCYYLPRFLFEQYGYKKTRWVVVRNTYVELCDTTQQTIFEWFPQGNYKAFERKYFLKYQAGYSVELLFRSCDNPEDVKKFKSLEVTGYWIDESIEVKKEIKLMLKNRIGRYPQKCAVRFGIETTNPPSVDHPTYYEFNWDEPPPGPITDRIPLENHAGFWQKPGENKKYLRPGYYDQLRKDYANNPDWIEMYIEGKPGVIQQGKLVYNNFKRKIHVAEASLVWAKGIIYRGWDNTGNHPACIIAQVPTALQIQILKEHWAEQMGIVDFVKYVKAWCSQEYPNAKFVDYGDPAGEAKFSKRSGGLTSNAQLMRENGINVLPSEQNFRARVEGVEDYLRRIDGMLIDPSCHILINGFLGAYHYAEIGTTGYFKDDPTKNKNADVHDALQYLCVKLLGLEDDERELDDIVLTDDEIAALPGNEGFIRDMI